MFTGMERSKMNNYYNLAIRKGIQPRFYYSILDVRELKTEQNGAIPAQTHKLVRLKCPWANAVEWKGDFSDSDPVWTREIKQKFN